MTLCYVDVITCPNPDAGLSNLFSTLLKKKPPQNKKKPKKTKTKNRKETKTKQTNKKKKKKNRTKTTLLRYTVDLYCSFSDDTKLSTKLCVKHDAASLEW